MPTPFFIVPPILSTGPPMSISNVRRLSPARPYFCPLTRQQQLRQQLRTDARAIFSIQVTTTVARGVQLQFVLSEASTAGADQLSDPRLEHLVYLLSHDAAFSSFLSFLRPLGKHASHAATDNRATSFTLIPGPLYPDGSAGGT